LLQRKSVTLTATKLCQGDNGGNAAPWKVWKTTLAVFPSSHRAWKSPRDFHIPTV